LHEPKTDELTGIEPLRVSVRKNLKRKAALQKELEHTERIVYTQHIGESGEKLFQAADQLGLEGVIGKKADSTYRAGRTPNWMKVKTAHGRHVDEERAKWNE
jgi:ATP-dependent DNA ligase